MLVWFGIILKRWWKKDNTLFLNLKIIIPQNVCEGWVHTLLNIIIQLSKISGVQSPPLDQYITMRRSIFPSLLFPVVFSKYPIKPVLTFICAVGLEIFSVLLFGLIPMFQCKDKEHHQHRGGQSETDWTAEKQEERQRYLFCSHQHCGELRPA